MCGGDLECLDGTGFAAFVEEGGDELDLVADDDEGFDFFVEVVESDLFEIAAGMLADEIEQGGTFRVGLVNSFACTVSAEAI